MRHSKLNHMKKSRKCLCTTMTSQMGLLNMAKSIQNEEHTIKILCALPKEWVHVKTSIHETQRLQPLTLNELIGTLVASEIGSNNEPSISEGKKFMTYKANTRHVNSEGSSSSDNDDKDMASTIQELQKLLKRNKKC